MILNNPIIGEEIQKILFSLKDNKAPSPEGFDVGFLSLEYCWRIVGSDTINAFRSFFTLCRLIK